MILVSRKSHVVKTQNLRQVMGLEFFLKTPFMLCFNYLLSKLLNKPDEISSDHHP